MVDGVLFVALGFFERVRMLPEQVHPFHLLLEEAERAAAARPPSIVVRKADACAVEQPDHSALVDSFLAQGENNLEVRMRRLQPFPMVLVGPDRHVAVDRGAGVQIGAQPLLERPDL